MLPTTNTGSYIAIAGLIVSALSYFGIVVEQAQIITIVAGLVAVYGLIHQIVQVKSQNAKGIRSGAVIDVKKR